MTPAGQSLKEESILGLVVYAPVAHLGLFLLGFVVHLAFPYPLVANGFLIPAGLALLFLGPALILWSQQSLRRIRSGIAGGAPHFAEGPYRITRNPTYVGLFLLTLGFALLANSLPLSVAAVVAFAIVRVALIPKEEALMEKKYGDAYRDYRNRVRRWL